MQAEHTVDALVVGAGFAGIYAAHRMRELGLSVLGLERGGGFGGTWYWNRYPGLKCDVESIDYSYSFSDEIQQEWVWSEKFPSQPEILRYLEFVVERLRLRELFRFGVEVTAAHWDEASGTWLVTTDAGERIRARFVVWATGILSTPKIPELPGRERFQGLVLNTATWPHEEQDFTGKRVAVIGTGSSGIQVIPIVARQAEHLYVLQRTPSYSLPARHRPLDPERLAAVKADYARIRAEARSSALGAVTGGSERSALEVTPEEREAAFDEAYEYGSPMRFASTFPDLISDLEANAFAADYVRRRIRERVRDQGLAERLLPDYPILGRRLCIDTDYYETFDRDNVTLVDLREEELVGLTPTGFATTAGERDVDVVILATGFDALTGTLRRIDVRGRDGLTIAGRWGAAPSNYLGLTVAGFPNSFMIQAPGSPSVSANVVLAIEQHVEFVGGLLEWMAARGLDVVDATPEAEREWVDHVAELAAGTVIPLTDSWYVGMNVEGKPRVVLQYVGGVGRYEEALRDVAAHGYRGFRFGAAAVEEESA